MRIFRRSSSAGAAWEFPISRKPRKETSQKRCLRVRPNFFKKESLQKQGKCFVLFVFWCFLWSFSVCSFKIRCLGFSGGFCEGFQPNSKSCQKEFFRDRELSVVLGIFGEGLVVASWSCIGCFKGYVSSSSLGYLREKQCLAGKKVPLPLGT